MNKVNLKKADILPYHSMGISKARHIGKDFQEFETPSSKELQEISLLFQAFHINVHVMGEK